MPKKYHLNQAELNWIAQEYNNGRTIEEIAIDTGISKQQVKRCLSEKGLMYLSWYKNAEEDSMLKYLKDIGITSASDLREAFA